MKKRLYLALFLILALLCPVGIAIGAWSSDITVSENGTASYDMLGCNVTADIDYMATYGFCNSTGNDTLVKRAGTPKPHMLVDDKIMFAIPIPVSSTNVLSFTTGNNELDHFYIIPGYGGYVTVDDEDSIELGDNFTLEQSGWVDTTDGAKFLVDKDGAFRTAISGNENISSVMEGDAWVEVAPQLAATHIKSLAVYNEKLYGGTQPLANLYEWNDANAWVQKAPRPGVETAILSMAVYNDKLYGGSNVNGQLLEWNDVGAWAVVAPKLAETGIYSLVVFDGKLYGGTASLGRLYEWDGVDEWVEVAGQLGGQTIIRDMVVFEGNLYGATSPNGELLMWDGVDTWVQKAPQLNAETTVYSLVVYDGKIYGGTEPNGMLYEWNGTNAWVEVAPKLGAETRIPSLAVYGGKLYGGTGSLTGELYEWDGVDEWIQVAPQLNGQTHIESSAVYNDKLYGGTAATGRLFEWNSTAVTATGVESGEIRVVTTADTANLTISVYDADDALIVSDTVALGGASVLHNDNDWSFLQNVMPYADNITISVNGTLALWFRPIDIISDNGTHAYLPDRATDVATNDGLFIWGANPSGVSATIGALADGISYAIGTVTPVPDVVPTYTPPVTTADAIKLAGLDDHPLTPAIHAISEITGLYELFFWWFGVFILACLLFGATYKWMKNLMISGAAFCLMMGYGVAMGIYDEFFIVLLIIILVGCVVYQNRRGMA